MPWFAYVCQKCGESVQRHRPVAYRDVPPRHNVPDGCWDGVLSRVAPVRGPDVSQWEQEKRRSARPSPERREPALPPSDPDASAP